MKKLTKWFWTQIFGATVQKKDLTRRSDRIRTRPFVLTANILLIGKGA